MRSILGLSALVISLAACSSGGSDQANYLPGVPDGSGQVMIAMAGDWMVTDVQIIETSDPNVVPLTGGIITLSDTEVTMVDGDPASREAIEQDLGMSLNSYVNQVDGQTVRYGYRIEANGMYLELGAAGGAVDADHIAVEAVTSMLLEPGTAPITVRTRYTLVRQVVPLQLAGAATESRARGTEAFFGWRQGTLQRFRDQAR